MYGVTRCRALEFTCAAYSMFSARSRRGNRGDAAWRLILLRQRLLDALESEVVVVRRLYVSFDAVRVGDAFSDGRYGMRDIATRLPVAE